MTVIGNHNIVWMKSATTGTGTLTLTTAVSGFLTFALGGVINGEVISYTIRDGTSSETGRGTYTSSGTTLSRDTVLSSTNGGSKITCSGNETVFITTAAEDIQPFASYYDNGGDSVSTGSTASLSIDTEWVDQFTLGTLATNQITLARKGWYVFWCSVTISSTANFNGNAVVGLEGFTKTEGYTSTMGIASDSINIGPFLYNASSTGDVIGPVTCINNLGATISAVVLELSLFKIGNST